MAVNKVVKSDGTTLIDLTEDTVTSSDHIVNGYVGHLRSGEQVTGTGGVTDVLVNNTSVVSDGVANVPLMGESVPGVATISNGVYGVKLWNRTTSPMIVISKASTDNVKNPSGGTMDFKPLVASQTNLTAFYGLAKAAGDTTQSASSNAVGTYTEEAKSAISNMLNGAVQIEGTTPTITALSGVRYICGEVATLDITPCANGICDIVFTSGSTATVLTLPSTVKFPDGEFVPEADTTYEINILNGIYGVVVAWT